MVAADAQRVPIAGDDPDARRDLLAENEFTGIDALGVDPGPASDDGRQRSSEQTFDHRGEMFVRLFIDVEVEDRTAVAPQRISPGVVGLPAAQRFEELQGQGRATYQ